MSQTTIQMLVILSLSIMPLLEARVAIPYGILVARLDPLLVFTISIIGNLVPVSPLLLLLERLETFSRKLTLNPSFQKLSFISKAYERWLSWYFLYADKIRRKAHPYVNKHGALGLAIFTMMPTPLTGAWTACLAAHVLGMNRKIAFVSIAFGVVGAALIVSFLVISLNVII